jgi:hypothetical protein
MVGVGLGKNRILKGFSQISAARWERLFAKTLHQHWIRIQGSTSLGSTGAPIAREHGSSCLSTQARTAAAVLLAKLLVNGLLDFSLTLHDYRGNAIINCALWLN